MAFMKLLIIGGTGVLSSAVVNEALKQNIEVTIVNRGKKKNVIPNGVRLIKADYRNEAIIKKELAGKHYDAVIDFICFNLKQIEYSINLLHKFADQYIFISTTCVYNTSLPGIKNEESEKVLKTWDYSINKWDCEKYLVKEGKELGFNYTIIRPCITYDDTRIPYGIMPPYGYHWTFVARILEGKPIIRWNGGTTRWNMMRVEDFAVGVVGVLGNPKAYGEAFNVSGDDSYSWNDVINALENLLGEKAVIFDMSSDEYGNYLSEKKGELTGRSLDQIVDNSKIKSIVKGFSSKYGLEEGMRKTLDAYRTENYQHGIDWYFDALTDYIIKKQCKIKHQNVSMYNLGFCDYLGNSTKKDKKQYYKTFYKDSLWMKLYNKLKLVKSKIRIRCLL